MTQIRGYRPEDAPALRDVLRQVWGDDPWAQEYYRFGPDAAADPTRFRCTLVAETDGAPVGFGSAWTNPFHPHALYVGVNVHPRYQGRGLGTQLLDALVRSGPGHLPLLGSTWEHSASGVHFLQRRGFTEVRRTWEPVLHLAEVAADLYADCEARCASLGYTIVPLSDLSRLPGGTERLAALLAEVYEAAHAVNPPRTMDLGGWVALLHRDPPDPEASFIACHRGRLAAMSAAHADLDHGLIISWQGVSQEHRHHERDLILALTRRQILAVRRRGLPELRGEFDSTNPWAMIQLQAFPFETSPCWVTFRR